MPSYAVNFRQNAGYIADGANQTYSLGGVYPETRGGLTFGWNTDVTANSRDRSGFVGEPRLSGVVFKPNNGTYIDFRIDLPGGAATYDIKLAIGDAGNDQNHKIELFDGTTSFATITGSTSPANFRDATGVNRTGANWPGDNVALSRVFTNNYMVIRLGRDSSDAFATTLAHVFINQTSSDPIPTLSGTITPGTITTNSIPISHPTGADNTAVTSYEYSKDAGSTWVDSASTSTSYTFTGLTASTSYPIRVRAKDGNGNVSTPPLEISLSTSAPADSTAPSWGGVTLSASSVTTTSFTVTASGVATDDTAVTGYETSFDGGATYTTNSPATSLSRAYSGGTPGATVQVRMRAFDAAGNRSTALSLAQTLNNTSITLGPFASNGTVWPNGTAIHVSWLPLGRIGSLASITPVDRTATLGSGGTVAVTGLAAGAGIAMVAKRVTSAADDEVCYQHGTVA